MRKLTLWGGGGLLLLALSVVVAVSLGSAAIPLRVVWGILGERAASWIGADALLREWGVFGSADWEANTESIVWKVRFPRVALAMLVGMLLSLAGAAFQGVLRNPLADPYILGIASGASVGASFVILFGLYVPLLGVWTVPLAAFATGMASLAAVFRLAGMQGKFRVETLLLSGVVIQAFLGSVVSFLVSLSDSVMNEIVFWMMGSLSLRGWKFAGTLLPFAGAGLLVLLSYSRTLNLFALGERQAGHLGVAVDRTKLVVLLTGTMMTAAAVSVSGVVGFAGLVVPHLVRLCVGPDYRLIVPLSALYGAIYMLWADTLARMLMSPAEIPLGVVTAMLGAPFFGYLLNRHKRKEMGA
ncbi:FecCD family ABC transporter permease [Paenibacillus thermoaerophilus]|uniref:FecCD family ABC transporter permease n=1 Tax=Paenibacillus thermoaerophilus TaxID=1215385 RepID=A0ABW2V999_9BACL|nr:iron ABC transporter permease [Paenibacillus thermoaerophilus]TMV06719.1 iron ABC transporter permease [Paenibacillus thermoaerophilus]